MKRLVAAALLLLIFCCGCRAPEHSRQLFLMDTVIELCAYGENSETALARAEEELRNIESVASPGNAESEIQMLNGAGSQAVSPMLRDLLEQSIALSRETNRAFDPALGNLIALWSNSGYVTGVPAADAIQTAKQKSGVDSIRIQADQVFLENQSTLHLGAVAKGYGADRVKAILEEEQVDSALISVGGSIYAKGQNPKTHAPWKIGIRDPNGDSSSYLAIIELADQIIATSGDYERYFLLDGIRYHHILNPETGYPAQSGLRSVSVICENGARADALSTALFVMGKEAALAFWCAHPDFECILIEENQRITVTPGIRDVFTLTGEGYTYETANR